MVLRKWFQTGCLVVCALLLLFSLAHAGIGEVGSMHEETADKPKASKSEARKDDKLQSTKSKEEPAQAAKPKPRKPLMIVRFNENYVHYERTLKKALEKSERRPGRNYEVVSFLPAGRNKQQNQRILLEGKKHLKEVTDAVIRAGISSYRVSSRTEAGKRGLEAQEIHLYIKEAQ